MNNSRLEYLFQTYLAKTHTEEEKLELMKLVEQPDSKEGIKQLIYSALQNADDQEMKMSEGAAKEILQVILGIGKVEETARIIEMPNARRRWWIGAAAAILIIMAGALWLKLDREQSTQPPVARQHNEQEILPGHNGAILTLADGTQIILDSIYGTIASEGGTTVVNKEGKLSYDQVAASPSQAIVYNTMTTPKGRQYQLQLPDGSKVWLNAASSITFPTVFAGKDRKVTITGEAYFEVAHNPSKPFIVHVPSLEGGGRPGMDVQVLGTHFNINSYADEGSVKTTLLEGKVRVTKGNVVVLNPGQQAEDKGGALLTIHNNVDVDAVVAWKNGFFQFNGMSVQAVMRQLERWYDINVTYEGKIPERKFAGQIDRNANLSEVLKILQESNVHFKLENRNLIVTP